ncbi:MAG: hypothetical protein ACRYHQ_05415 [Janthinobacterium lividum]
MPMVSVAGPRLRLAQRTALAMLLLSCAANIINRAVLALANPLFRHNL